MNNNIGLSEQIKSQTLQNNKWQKKIVLFFVFIKIKKQTLKKKKLEPARVVANKDQGDRNDRRGEGTWSRREASD